MYEVYAKARDEIGYTDYRVCKEAGISQAIISRWKHGKAIPKANKMLKIAKIVGLSVNELIE